MMANPHLGYSIAFNSLRNLRTMIWKIPDSLLQGFTKNDLLRDIPRLLDVYLPLVCNEMEKIEKEFNPEQLLKWWMVDDRFSAAGAWGLLFKLFVLLVPSSAASERVFSMYQQMFSSNQRRMKETSLEVGLMTHYRQNVTEAFE